MGQPRTSTATILFTDVVGSTELLQRAGDERAARVFRAHHDLLSQAVKSHGGHEVKWLGDGLMVAFSSATDAARCGIAIQQAARRPTVGERLEVRVGLNVGETIRSEVDYFGTAVVVARRLCDRADAGQVYVSELLVNLLAGQQQFRFESLGTLSLVLLGPVVEVLLAPMGRVLPNDPSDCLAVGGMVVRRHAQGASSIEVQQSTEKLASRPAVAVLAEHRIEEIAVPVDGAIQVAPVASDLQVGLDQIL